MSTEYIRYGMEPFKIDNGPDLGLAQVEATFRKIGEAKVRDVSNYSAGEHPPSLWVSGRPGVARLG